MKKAAVLLLAVLCLVIFTSCSSPEKKIIGTWKAQNTVLGVVTETVMKFNEDGSGSVSTALGIDLASTYTITDTALTITTSALGIENSTEYIYEFEGKKLTLTSGGNVIELEKQE